MGAALRHAGQQAHPNHVILRPPVNVSPFIRASRYSMLLFGIAYGWYRYRELKAIHVEVRDYEHRQQLADEHNQHKIKKWKAAEDMELLAKELGLPWTTELQQQLGIGAATKENNH